MSGTGIDIAAAGKAERLREQIIELGYPDDFPKLLLPTGQDHETLLGRIIRQSMVAPLDGPVTICTTPTNERHIRAHPDIRPLIDEDSVRTRFIEYGNSFRAFLPKLVAREKRVLGSSGDYYADFTWSDVLDAHESHGYPVTFMVGRSIPVQDGAVFDVDDRGKITQFSRVGQTTGEEFVNIGVYVFDPAPKVLELMHELVTGQRMAKEETVAERLIEIGAAGAYVAPGTPYNVNTPETYAALLAHVHQNDSNASLKNVV